MTNASVLDLPMQQPNDADAETIRDYLRNLLLELWREQDGFSGKRPFGNSGWKYDLYLPLIQAGWVTGVLDDDGYIEDVDSHTADGIIADAIRSL